MSDLMLQAIIGMPYKLAMEGEIARRQFHSRAQSLLVDYDQLRTANQPLEGEVNRLRLALTLAANRLDRLTLELPGGYWREESAEWTSQARAALSTNGEVTE